MTLDNLADRGQYINVRNTFTELLAYGVVPVVNENVGHSILSSINLENLFTLYFTKESCLFGIGIQSFSFLSSRVNVGYGRSAGA